MKSIGERHWMKMSMHGKKAFLSHNQFDKGLATSTWSNLPKPVQKQFEQNPVVTTDISQSE
jgi:hypothetical protein